MSAIPSFPEEQIEQLAKLLGDCSTGSDIARVLKDRGLEDPGWEDGARESTKWKRLYSAFMRSQEQYKCANHIVDFIQSFLSPVRFVDRKEEFEGHRQQLNAILAFSGLEYHADGIVRQREVAHTLEEAETRLQTIQSKFRARRIHPEVLTYCRTELLQENYFHAVFEATKGLAQKIRDLSGVQGDGAELVDKVFLGERPILAINTLQTDTEKSVQKGFAALLKGCFAAIRNPLAHEPKILWEEGEDDMADYLSLVSLLYRKLDRCSSTHPGSPQ
jgi:uncharacterized protein (TIGR02391 family)